jgi:hypothetical protein
LMVNLKGTTQRFGSTSPECGRVAVVGTWHDGATGNNQRWETSGENRSSGLCRLVGQLGRCEAFGPGEEGGCSGLRWAKRLDGLDAMVGFTMKNQEKEKG